MDINNIELKEDSAEKIAAVAGKPTKHYLFAEEFNALVTKMKNLVVPTDASENNLTEATTNNDTYISPVKLWSWFKNIILNRNNNFNGTNTFSGNVGIGTTTPTEKLEVTGSIKALSYKIPWGEMSKIDHNGISFENYITITPFGNIYNKFTHAINIQENGGNANFGGKVGIGTTNPLAALHIESNTQGFLMPRMGVIERMAIINPEVGLMVYQTDGTSGIWRYRNTGWAHLG